MIDTYYYKGYTIELNYNTMLYLLYINNDLIIPYDNIIDIYELIDNRL